MSTGFINEITKGEKENTFTGKVGNQSFDNASIYLKDGKQITSLNEISLDTLVSYDSTPITDMKVKVLVKTTNSLDRQSTYSHIQNLVNAIEKETGTDIIVDIRK